MSVRKQLGELQRGQGGRIVSLSAASQMTTRLMSMGMLEGSWVEVFHEAPFGGDPIAVKVRGALIALRRNEANTISVEVGGERDV